MRHKTAWSGDTTNLEKREIKSNKRDYSFFAYEHANKKYLRHCLIQEPIPGVTDILSALEKD